MRILTASEQSLYIKRKDNPFRYIRWEEWVAPRLTFFLRRYRGYRNKYSYRWQHYRNLLDVVLHGPRPMAYIWTDGTTVISKSCWSHGKWPPRGPCCTPLHTTYTPSSVEAGTVNQRVYREGMVLAIQLPSGEITEISPRHYAQVITGDNRILDYAPLSHFPILVL